MDRASEEAQKARLQLVRDDRGLALTDGVLVVRGDFRHMTARVSARNLNRELLVKAAKVKVAYKGPDDGPTAVDATAGLGEDALLLAAAGFTVTLYERNPVVAALLRDALQRAASIPELAGAVQRMRLVEGDSVQALFNLGWQPDVVLLDPMFPSKTKTALVKKKLQLLQQLELPCEDESTLLNAALAAHPRKVVIKRPVKGPHLAGRAPDYSLAGKAIRYDIIVVPPVGYDD